MKKFAAQKDNSSFQWSPETPFNDELECFDLEEKKAYLEEMSPAVNLVVPKNYVDFENLDDPLQ